MMLKLTIEACRRIWDRGCWKRIWQLPPFIYRPPYLQLPLHMQVADKKHWCAPKN